MFLSGAAIGTAVGITNHRHKIIPKGHLRALIACFVGAVGSTLPSTAVWLVVSTATPTTLTTTTGCALPFKFAKCGILFVNRYYPSVPTVNIIDFCSSAGTIV